MTINFTFKDQKVEKIKQIFEKISWEKFVVILSIILGIFATIYTFLHNTLLAYGDAESHINIAKRVTDSLTPGFAQLGGIWLPLPHLLMVPFVYFDLLWRTGFAGSIVSGIAFVIASLFIYKLTYLITKNSYASFFAFLVFALNPNVLYMQSTPMTELPLIVFFILSTYYFIKYLKSKDNLLLLILTAFFGFCAALSRYDGWFLVLIEGMVLCQYFIQKKYSFNKLQGRLIIFATLAFFGVGLWLMWDFLILGDPLYFSNSVYSASSQQHNWLGKGELPGYHNILISFLYYFVTSMSLSGIILFLSSLVGCFVFIKHRHNNKHISLIILLLVPFIFNWLSLFIGQSVIFIPSLTPLSFEWRLFNVRYGIMMVPFVSFMLGYLFSNTRYLGKTILCALLIFQLLLFGIGYSKVLSLADGTEGLSSAKNPDAQVWLSKHYNGGLVLLDDYSRTISIVKSGIPMHSIINVGTKPYYEDSFKQPNKYATWIVMQNNDEIWNHLYATTAEKGNLYKYFKKVYTSPVILIFEKS